MKKEWTCLVAWLQGCLAVLSQEGCLAVLYGCLGVLWVCVCIMYEVAYIHPTYSQQMTYK